MPKKKTKTTTKKAVKIVKKTAKTTKKEAAKIEKIKLLNIHNSSFLEFKGFLTFLMMHEIKQRPMCGDDLASKIGARKGTVLTPGTIYPALKKLRKNKLVTYKKFGRKKMYTLTELGEKELEILYKLFSQYFLGMKKYIIRN